MEIQASEAEEKFCLINGTLSNFVLNAIGSYERALKELGSVLEQVKRDNATLKAENEELKNQMRDVS